jgi:hypothetical protein
MADPGRRMTKAERDDLIRLIKQRERVAKTAAEQRSAAMLVDFEQQISKLHDWNKDEIWKAAVEAVKEAAQKASTEIAERADALGIPSEFQPSLSFQWLRRGETEYQTRREELRRVAKAEIGALEKVAFVQIERESVRAQTEVIANGLNSVAAIEFLNSLPSIESMMPALDVADIQAKLAERARKGGRYLGPALVE